MNALHCVESEWLAEKLKNQRANSVVVLDLRKSQDFLTGHVRSSVNLPCQNSHQLMERGVRCLEQLLVATSSAEDRERLASRSRSENVVLYDQESTEERPEAALVAVADMLVAEKCRHVCFVNGGFSHILQCQKDIVSAPKRSKGTGRPKIAPLSIPKSSEVSIIHKCMSAPAVTSTRGLISEVLPGVFLGDEVNAEDRACMVRHGITDVFNVTSDLPNVFEADPALHLNYIRFAVTDVMTSDLQLYFKKSHDIIAAILARKGRVLVHCLAGISRSPTLVIAYIMRAKLWSFDSTFDFVRLRKSNVNPNFGFLQQLRSLEDDLIKDAGPLTQFDLDALCKLTDKLFEKKSDGVVPSPPLSEEPNSEISVHTEVHTNSH